VPRNSSLAAVIGPAPDHEAVSGTPSRRSAYLQSAVIVGLCTAVAWQLSPYFRTSNLLMIYLMGTVVVATRLGEGPSAVSALLSATIFSILFVPPRLGLGLPSAEYLVTFAVLVVVALIISNRSGRLREQMVAIRQYERQAAAVRESARLVQVVQLQGLAAAALSIGASPSIEDALRVLAEQARAIIGAHLSVVRLCPDPDRQLAPPSVSASADSERYVMATERPVNVSPLSHIRGPTRMNRAQIDADPACREWRPVDGGPPPQGWLAAPLVGPAGRQLGVIELFDKHTGHFTEADEAIVVQLTQMASAAIEKARLYQDAERRRQAAEQINAMSHALATTLDVAELLRTGLRNISDVCGSGVVVLVPDANGELAPRWRYPETAEAELVDPEASRWAYEHRQPAGGGTGRFSEASTFYLPLVGSRETLGVLTVTPRDIGAVHASGQLLLLETLVNQIALAVERATLAEQAREAHLRVETERLRSSLLSSISHDLRTPLAAITGAASSLLWREEEFDPDTRRELKESIYEEAERLARLVENLLDMTRLESGIKARQEWQPLEDVVGAALARLERRLQGRTVMTRLPDDLPLVPIDDVLIEQVLINLLDNAIKYTDANSPLEVSASSSDSGVMVEVADRGPGLEAGNEERVFEKFYRGERRQTRGAGLGLAICRGIVETHGGRIWAENRAGGGTVFRFTLPMEPLSLEAPQA
jgi:K+-sensing histidine kinase KdpD